MICRRNAARNQLKSYMRMPLVKHQTSFTILGGLLLLLLVTACGSNTSSATSSSSTTASSTPTATQAVGTGASAKEKALLPLMTLVGQPTAKLVSEHHTFEVDGKIKNGDTKQHDIYVQVTLLDASGAIVGSSAFFNMDNVPGGATVSFAIQGTTMQPTWASIQVKVVGLSENLGSSGDD
jgi:ABC-type phosphate transport system substrate-binding protein